MTRHHSSWRHRLFIAGLVGAGMTWLVAAVDIALSLAYGWHDSLIGQLYNGDWPIQVAFLWWCCGIIIALHAED